MPEALYKDNTSDYTPAMAKKAPFNFRLDPEIMEHLAKHAEAEGRSRNNLIDRIFLAYDTDPAVRERVRQLQAPVVDSD